MSFIYSKQTYHKISDASHTVSHECVEVNFKPTDAALFALVSAQGSCVILSYIYPNHAFLIQTGVLTCALALFLKIHHLQAQKRTDLKVVHSFKNSITRKPPRAPTPVPKDITTPIGSINIQKITLDDRLDLLTNDIIRLKFWKLIPHPLYGGARE